MKIAVTAELTEDKQGIKVGFEGGVTFQQAIAMSNAILLHGIEVFQKQLIEEGVDEDEQKLYAEQLYDDLNIRFTNILDGVIPEKDLPVDFTDEAQLALRDEDEYIELKFKALQYDKVVDALGDEWETLEVSVGVDEKGEFDL